MGGPCHERLVSAHIIINCFLEVTGDLTCILLRYGTYSTVEALEAGLDLEMPGPSRWRGQLVNHAVSSKKLLPDTIDQRVRAVLKSVQRAVATGIPEHAEEEGRDLPETAALLRQIAGDSVVLLKNEKKTLPFQKTKTVSKKPIFSSSSFISLTLHSGSHNWAECKSCDLLRRRVCDPAPLLCRHAV